MDRPDKPDFGNKRCEALAKHPLRDKISTLNICESLYWNNKKAEEAHQLNYILVRDWLKPFLHKADEVWTHNAKGEYGHSDHILVHEVVKELAGTIYCLGEGGIYRDTDFDSYFKIKDLYQRYKVWTWDKDYVPPKRREYIKIK